MKEFYRYQPEYLERGGCDPACIVQGKHFRFCVLTENLIRLEYSKEGVFEDRPSQVVLNRRFAVPEFSVRESEDKLENQLLLVLAILSGIEPLSMGLELWLQDAKLAYFLSIILLCSLWFAFFAIRKAKHRKMRREAEHHAAKAEKKEKRNKK